MPPLCRVARATISYQDIKLDEKKFAAFVGEWNQRRSVRGQRYKLRLPCWINGKEAKVVCLDKKKQSFIMEILPFDTEGDPQTNTTLYHYFAVNQEGDRFSLGLKVFIMECPTRATPAQRNAVIAQYF